MNESGKFRYGHPVSAKEMPKPRKRLPQYDEALREFSKFGYDNWEVNMDALPSKKPRVVLSSLKWRVKNKQEFEKIKVFMYKNKIYLERIKE